MDARTEFETAAACLRAGDLPAAEAGFRATLRLKPDAVPAHENLILTLSAQGRYEDLPGALAARLEARDEPMVRFRLAEALLAVGRYAEAWPYFEARPPLAASPAQAASFPEWRGQSLDGQSILVWGEQGLGDQIQFARFIPRLRDLGARRIVLATHPALMRLFAGLPVDQVISQLGDVVVQRCDHWISLLSLATRLGATPETLPQPPYLQRPQSAASRRRVGVVWRGGDLFARNARRSLPSPDLLQPLADAGAELVDLQAPRGDMLHSLERLAEVDLLVTVDTSWAHLAGATGVPAWVMLPRPHLCWRWGIEGSGTPWYPSLRLFRQPEAGDWPAVVRDVTTAFAARLEAG